MLEDSLSDSILIEFLIESSRIGVNTARVSLQWRSIEPKHRVMATVVVDKRAYVLWSF